jgi:hypothetical protein
MRTLRKSIGASSNSKTLSNADLVQLQMTWPEDLAAVEKRLDDCIDGAIVKIDGVQNTLDARALVRADQRLPERVESIEKHVGITKKIAA